MGQFALTTNVPGTQEIALSDGGSIDAQALPTSALVAASGSNFVYAPGGTAGGNVYVTGESLRQAVNAVQGARSITLDGRFAASAHLTAGEWDLDSVTIGCVAFAANFTLTIDEGVVIKNTGTLRITDGLLLKNAATATVPFQDVNNGEFSTILLDGNGTQLESAAGATVFSSCSVSGSVVYLVGTNATLGDGVHNIASVAAGQTMALDLTGLAAILAHALSGAGTASVNVSTSSTVQTPQDVTTLTLINVGKSQQVAFTPAVAGNWGTIPPTQVKQALDQLAQPNNAHQQSATGSGTANISLSIASGAKSKSGSVLVAGTLCVTAANSGTLQGNLVGTSGTIGNANTPVTAGNAAYITICALDTIPAGGTTYSLNLTNSGGGNLTLVGIPNLNVVELV